MNEKRSREERKIADQPQNPGTSALPESPFPCEKTAVVEKTLDNHGKRCQYDAVEDAVVDTQNLLLRIFRQHQADSNSHNQEHERYLNIVSDHQQPGRISYTDRRSPDRSVTADEADHGIPDFIKELSEKINGAKGIAVVDYRGITVEDITALQ